jgi:hypothetical protein
MGYATAQNDSFSLAPERLTRDEVNRACVSFSRRRDFTVPFSKPRWRPDYTFEATRRSERGCMSAKLARFALISVVAFLCCSPFKAASSMLVVICDESEICTSSGSKSIPVLHPTVEEESRLPLRNFFSGDVSNDCLHYEGHFRCLTGEQCRFAFPRKLPIGKFISGQRVIVKIRSYPKVERGGLSRVFDNDFRFGELLIVGLQKGRGINANIRAQFLFARSPSLDGVNGQEASEHGHESRAEKIDDGLVAVTPREEFIFATSVFFVFFLPVVAAWVGYSGWGRTCLGLIIGWWLLIACVFLNVGGLWS